jgi:hypothetical protein
MASCCCQVPPWSSICLLLSPTVGLTPLTFPLPALLPAELRPLSRDTNLLEEGSGSGATLALDEEQQRQPGLDTAGRAHADWDLGSGSGGGPGASASQQHSQQQQQQQLEEVATVGGARVAPGGTSAATDGRQYSSCTIYAVRNGSGQLAKFYYKFRNVRLTRKGLYFYMPPGGGQQGWSWHASCHSTSSVSSAAGQVS